MEEYCYNCGHAREDHRVIVDVARRENRYVDCLRPVAERTTIFKFKFLSICQCTEYTTKDKCQLSPDIVSS